MHTIAKNTSVSNVAVATATKKQESALWKKAEDARYGIIPLLLTLVACTGGIAASFGTNNSAFQLSLIVFPTMLCLSFMLAVAPMKLVLWSSLIAILFDLSVFIV